MHAIVGASGKVGFTTAARLRQAGVSVRAIVRDATKAASLTDLGCEVATADLHDAQALSKAFAGAHTVQIIVPVNAALPQPVEDMTQTMDCLEAALKNARPARILLISDYGAHVPHDVGLPSVFGGFEQRISALEGHKIILRSAEHMQNFARGIPLAKATGIFSTLHSAIDKPFPQISAPDLGIIAAELHLEASRSDGVQVVHAEGPRRYGAEDMAAVLAKLLDREVKAQSLPRDQWDAILGRGIHESLVKLIVRANDVQNEDDLIDVQLDCEDIRYGTTDLEEALRPLVYS